jgi:hypothetical protein
MISYDEYKNNIRQLKKLIPYIDNISILGGEPLLHPELKDIIQITNETYPNAIVVVTTNAIKLLNISNDLLNELRKKNVMVSISLYPSLKLNLDLWIDFLRKNNICYSINNCNKFQKILLKHPVIDGRENSKRCGHCITLKGSKIARCPHSLCVKYFNGYFGKIIPEYQGIDIFEMKNGMHLLHELENPVELCNYCVVMDLIFKKWESLPKTKMKQEDWFLSIPEGIFG